MKLINSEKAIGYAKEKDYIKTSGQEEAVREVFAFATVEAVPVDVIDKIREEIKDLHNSHMIHLIDADGVVDTCLEIIDKRILGQIEGEADGK